MAAPQQQGSIEVAALPQVADAALVTITNPRRANSLDAAMLAQLEQLCANELRELPAIVFTGAGERHFCAGADVNAWGPLEPAAFGADWVAHGNEVLAKVAALPGVTIGAINGTCFGGGLELALRLDVLQASASASFALPETALGAIPGWLGGTLLARRVGAELAARMVLCGQVLDAKQARETGLVGALSAKERLLEDAIALASAAATRSFGANREAKRLLGVPLEEAAALHQELAVKTKAAPDGAEGLAAFAAKRPPRFISPKAKASKS